MRKITFAALALCTAALFSATSLAARQRTETSAKELTGVININTASVQQLVILPGIGESIAQRIVEYRAQKAFKRPEDLRAVKGIGEQKYKKLSRFISVSGPTTLAEAPRSAQRALPAAQLAPAALDTLAHV